jgi:hypothetical protein
MGTPMTAGNPGAGRAELLRLLNGVLTGAAWGVLTAIGIRCVARGLVGGASRHTTDRPGPDPR